MNKSKIFVVILILGAGIIGSYLIIRNAEPKNLSAENSEKKSEPAPQESLSGKPFKFPENNSLSLGKNNLTQALGETFFDVVNSPETLEEIRNGIVTDPDFLSSQVANDLMSKKMADLNFVSEISDREIKISKDTSLEAKKKYLEEATKIVQKDFGDFNKNYFQVVIDVYQKVDVSSAARLTEIYKKLAADFSELPVPADWVSIHKEIIINYKNSGVVYSAMANYPTDPIKGYLALEAVDKVANKAVALQSELVKTVERTR